MEEEEEIEAVQEEARERSLEEAVREGIRARKFTEEETLKQGMELIDFARRVNSRDGELGVEEEFAELEERGSQ